LSRDSANWRFWEDGLQESGESNGETSSFAETLRVYLTIEWDSFNFNFIVARIPFVAIGLRTNGNVTA
jgi:hypothetical protein